jgi:hypothetical protein
VLPVAFLCNLYATFFVPGDEETIDTIMGIINAVAATITALGAVAIALYPNGEIPGPVAWRANLYGRCAIAGGAIFLALTSWFEIASVK